MCLATITKTGLNQSGYGWKRFGIKKTGLHSVYQDDILPKTKINRWLQAVKIQCDTDNNSNKETYMTGFHIFIKKVDAQNIITFSPFTTTVKRVKYRKGRILGENYITYTDQPTGACIVADEMLILPARVKK